MFRLANTGKVYWRVLLVARNEETGQPEDVTVFIQYKIYSRSELKAREKQLSAPLSRLRSVSKDDATAEATLKSAMKDLEAMEARTTKELQDRVLGWRDIGGENGEALPFSMENLRALLEDDAQYERIAAGLIDASKGAKAKNSLPGPAGSAALGQM